MIAPTLPPIKWRANPRLVPVFEIKLVPLARVYEFAPNDEKLFIDVWAFGIVAAIHEGRG